MWGAAQSCQNVAPGGQKHENNPAALLLGLPQLYQQGATSITPGCGAASTRTGRDEAAGDDLLGICWW